MGKIVNKFGIFSRPLSLLAVMTMESRVEWQVCVCVEGVRHGPQAYCQSLGRVTRTSGLVTASARLIVPQGVPLNHHIYCYSYAFPGSNAPKFTVLSDCSSRMYSQRLSSHFPDHNIFQSGWAYTVLQTWLQCVPESHSFLESKDIPWRSDQQPRGHLSHLFSEFQVIRVCTSTFGYENKGSTFWPFSKQHFYVPFFQVHLQIKNGPSKWCFPNKF